jgi:hypothetical protein
MYLCEIFDACRERNIEKVQRLSLVCTQKELNIVMYNSCSIGDMDIVQLMISKGANDWNTGLICACDGRHSDIIKLMISKGADSWNKVLYFCSDDIEIIHFLIILGTGIENFMSKNEIEYYKKYLLLKLCQEKNDKYFLSKYFNDDIIYMICRYM